MNLKEASQLAKREKAYWSKYNKVAKQKKKWLGSKQKEGNK